MTAHVQEDGASKPETLTIRRECVVQPREPRRPYSWWVDPLPGIEFVLVESEGVPFASVVAFLKVHGRRLAGAGTFDSCREALLKELSDLETPPTLVYLEAETGQLLCSDMSDPLDDHVYWKRDAWLSNCWLLCH